MPKREQAALLLATAWTFVPMYAVERLADYYYLADNSSAFFTVSGWRLPLFIVFAVACSTGAGLLLKSVWKAAASTTVAVAGFILAVFALCDPRVCYSAGLDGLEPLRLGFFLASIMVAGGGLGVALRRGPISLASRAAVSFFGLAAVCYYPVIFTFAGAGLFPPFSPWAASLLVAVACLSMSVTLSLDLGARLGLPLTLASLTAVIGLSAGISTAYLSSVVPAVLALMLGGIGAAVAGAAVARTWRKRALARRPFFSLIFSLCLLAVILMMIVAVPDEVAGLVPTSGSGGQSFAIGSPVYSGAFVDGAPGHSGGAAVTVSFNGTVPSSIQADNFLSAGLGIHAAGCCVDGIDYSYRFDLYLFHSGNEELMATAWEACDDNAACGGHSWKVLMFVRADPINEPVSDPVRLAVAWINLGGSYGVDWSYSVAGEPSVNFTRFVAPAAENHDFNTGVLPGGTLGPGQSASYFFQFGIMSRYPIGHPGWRASFTCPSLLVGSWSCASEVRTLAGSQSYWKVFWRWGEEYPDVSVMPSTNYAAGFAYSGSGGTPSFTELW
jgi:hypothetical protein